MSVIERYGPLRREVSEHHKDVRRKMNPIEQLMFDIRILLNNVGCLQNSGVYSVNHSPVLQERYLGKAEELYSGYCKCFGHVPEIDAEIARLRENARSIDVFLREVREIRGHSPNGSSFEISVPLCLQVQGV